MQFHINNWLAPSMFRRFAKAANVCLALVALSCLVSIMVTFMGGYYGGSDMTALLLLQLASVPVSLLLIIAALIFVRGRVDRKDTLKILWDSLPQWLLFIFLFLNSLVVIGEIALYIAGQITNAEQSWLAHVPLASALSTSMAFLMLYAAQYFDRTDHNALSGRWHA